MTAVDQFDPWTGIPDSVGGTVSLGAVVTQINDVVPLDEQLGVWPTKKLPDALDDPLFGEPDPTSQDIATAGGLDDVPAMQTFAILDAARIADLPEMLADTNLLHRCLFKGDALEALGDVAPWVVQLERDNAFTTRLFTDVPDIDVPWHYWRKEPGIYVRTRGTLDDVWRHFRKFTKVQDNAGKWFYFRFWEPREIAAIVQQDIAQGLLAPTSGPPIHAIFAPTRDVTYAIAPAPKSQEAPGRFILNPDTRTAIDDRIEARFAADFAKTLLQTANGQARWLGDETGAQTAQMVIAVIGTLKPLGFQKRSDIGRIAAMALFYGTYFLYDPRVVPLARHHLSGGKVAKSPGLRAKSFEAALSETKLPAAIADHAALPAIISHLQFAFTNPHLPAHWLSQVYTPAQGFSDPNAAAQFIEACNSQLDQAQITDLARQRAHYILAVLFTPYFLVDPLHRPLQSLFHSSTDFEARLMAALENRLNQ